MPGKAAHEYDRPVQSQRDGINKAEISFKDSISNISELKPTLELLEKHSKAGDEEAAQLLERYYDGIKQLATIAADASFRGLRPIRDPNESAEYRTEIGVTPTKVMPQGEVVTTEYDPFLDLVD
jgi:hypothetical protein